MYVQTLQAKRYTLQWPLLSFFFQMTLSLFEFLSLHIVPIFLRRKYVSNEKERCPYFWASLYKSINSLLATVLDQIFHTMYILYPS